MIRLHFIENWEINGSRTTRWGCKNCKKKYETSYISTANVGVSEEKNRHNPVDSPSQLERRYAQSHVHPNKAWQTVPTNIVHYCSIFVIMLGGLFSSFWLWLEIFLSFSFFLFLFLVYCFFPFSFVAHKIQSWPTIGTSIACIACIAWIACITMSGPATCG